jgi:hypothetical protein
VLKCLSLASRICAALGLVLFQIWDVTPFWSTPVTHLLATEASLGRRAVQVVRVGEVGQVVGWEVKAT